MSWQTPSFVEINMSAEIGAYQDDNGDERPEEFVEAESSPTSNAAPR